jgi:hypothetical protein
LEGAAAWGTAVAVAVCVAVGSSVAVAVEVSVAVAVGVSVGVFVAVDVGVSVGGKEVSVGGNGVFVGSCVASICSGSPVPEQAASNRNSMKTNVIFKVEESVIKI